MLSKLFKELHFWVFTGIIFTSFIILGFLIGFRVIGINWINSYIISCFAFILNLLILKYAVRKLVTKENIYFYLLLFVFRVGVIAVPLLFVIYFSNFFCIYGYIIGLIFLILSPVVSYQKQKTKKD